MEDIYVQINEKMEFDRRCFDGSAWCGHTGHGEADSGGVWMTQYYGTGANLERLEIDRAASVKKGARVKVWLSHAGHLRRSWIEGRLFFVNFDELMKKLSGLPESAFFAGPAHIYSLLFEDFEEVV